MDITQRIMLHRLPILAGIVLSSIVLQTFATETCTFSLTPQDSLVDFKDRVLRPYLERTLTSKKDEDVVICLGPDLNDESSTSLVFTKEDKHFLGSHRRIVWQGSNEVPSGVAGWHSPWYDKTTGITGYIVVQVGTNDGNDHVLNLCARMHCDTIILVEPFDVHNATIAKNYGDRGINHFTLENVAIVPSPMPNVTLYYTEEDGPANISSRSYEITSMKPEHLIKHKYTSASLRSFTVPALTVGQLLDEHGLMTVDYLFLDIEGIDWEVLQSIDFARYNIQRLQIEHLHLEKKRLLDYMAAQGYTNHAGLDRFGFDTMFVRRNNSSSSS